jgi:hypothetical protein
MGPGVRVVLQTAERVGLMSLEEVKASEQLEIQQVYTVTLRTSRNRAWWTLLKLLCKADCNSHYCLLQNLCDDPPSAASRVPASPHCALESHV